MNITTGKRVLVVILLFMLLSCLFLLFSVNAEEADPELSYEILLGDGRIPWNPGLENESGDSACGGSGPSGGEQGERIRFFFRSEDLGYGFVIPDAWDASRLRIFLEGIESVRIDGRDYRNGDPVSLSLNEEIVVTPGKFEARLDAPLSEEIPAVPEEDKASPDNEPIVIEVCKTGGLPVLFIRTESGNADAIHADKTVSEPGHLQMTDAAGEPVYEGDLSAVRARGNATFIYKKKPYQIKLKKAAALAGERKAKTWILLANVIDRSQIRNKLALDMAAYSGAFAYTPYGEPVDLYMNGDYMGTYLLAEKAEVQKNRLQITDLEKIVKTMNPDLDLSELDPLGDPAYDLGAQKYYDIPEEPEDLSGGYLFQINVPLRYETEASAFVTNRGCAFTAQEPKYLSEAQITYLSGLVQRIEDALFSDDGIDPASGLHYTELLDMNTFVHKYLMAEVLDDYDGQFSYFYKNTDAIDPKVYVGPVWDQDNILGVWLPQNDPAAIHLSDEYPEYFSWFWFTQASRHEEFMNAVRETYQNTYRPAVLILLGEEKDPSGTLRSIDEYAEQVRVSAEADFFRWGFPLLSNTERYNTRTGSSFEKQITYLQDYLSVRLDALDEFFLQPAEPD